MMGHFSLPVLMSGIPMWILDGDMGKHTMHATQAHLKLTLAKIDKDIYAGNVSANFDCQDWMNSKGGG